MKIVWTEDALQQLDEAREYIEIENPRAAVRLIDQIETSVNRLRVFPLIGRSGFRPTTRELVVPNTPYIIVYLVRGDVVYILAVIYGATDWQMIWNPIED